MTASSSLRQIDHVEPSIAGILEAHASKHVGVAVGLLAGNMTRTFAHGALLEDEPASAEDVIFEIGSITKVFTATLLADMALAGEVALDDPVQMHLPDHVRLAQRGRPITLADLSSHVSGLSRLPPGFLRSLTKQQRSNPYADFGVDDLYRAVGVVRLRRSPGAKVRYSNFGAGLLGAVLARRAGTSYEQLVQDRICVPLGLRDTSIDVPAAKLGRFADGHDRRGRAAAHWDALALAGAGALRSTVADMLVFMRLQLGAPAGRLAEAAKLTHETRAGRPGRGAVGLGWHGQQLNRTSSRTMLCHNGGTGGFHSFCGFITETKTGVIVLSNSARSVDEIGALVLEALDTT